MEMLPNFSRTIFLDIDGVLVTKPFRERRVDALVCNPDCIRELNRIWMVVTNTTPPPYPSLILSSSWRYCGLIEMRGVLNRWGVHADLITITPDLSTYDQATGLWVAAPRWQEIEMAVQEGPYAILDDEPDMGPLSKYHVRTEYATGLTTELADRCIDLLRGR